MEGLPEHVIGEIVKRLPDARSCLCAAAASRQLQSEGSRSCAERVQRWRAWLDDSYLGTELDARMVRRGAQLDMNMLRVIEDLDAQCATFWQLDNCERRWLHMRASSLALITTTYNRYRDRMTPGISTIADLLVTKPRNWKMPWDSPPTIPRTARAGIAIRRLRRIEWRGWCESCTCCLNSWSAMFELERGLGPYCEGCIDGDDELRDLAWECNADSY